MLQALNLTGMWRNLQRHVELASLLRGEDLLPHKVDQALTLLVIRNDWQIGLDAQEFDLVGSDLRSELPLVEGKVPVGFAEDQFACPSARVLDPGLDEVL